MAAVKAEHARLRAAGFKGKLKKPSTRPDRHAAAAAAGGAARAAAGRQSCRCLLHASALPPELAASPCCQLRLCCRSAESIMLNQGLALRGQHVAGHTPGVEVGTRCAPALERRNSPAFMRCHACVLCPILRGMRLG